MSVLTDIIKWSGEIPSWQGDAVRRIIEKVILEESDKKEIIEMFKKESGLIEDLAGRIPSPKLLELPKIEISSGEEILMILKSMGPLQNVNALATDQILEFAENGVTVIYGVNASGKSGYARVLKKACRARGYVDPILPNVYGGSGKDDPAKAIFHISINGEDEEVNWSDDDENPDEMSYIAVFDSKSERFYVDENNTMTYIPYGLDVFEKLADFCDEVREILKNDRVPVNDLPEELKQIPKSSEVGILLDSLDRDTTTKQIDDLATISEKEKAEQKQLKALVNNLEKIEESITRRKRLKARVKKIKEVLLKFDMHLTDDNYTKLKKSSELVLSLQKDAEEISKTQFRDEPLIGIGGNPWRALYHAAERYSTEVAYPNQVFPYLASDSVCVLCQQPIEEEAQKRFGKFKKFIKSDIQKNINVAKTEKEKLTKIFEELDYSFALIDTEVLDDIGDYKETTKIDIEGYIESVKSCDRKIRANIKKNEWEIKPHFALSPKDLLVQMEEKLQDEIDEKEGIKDPEIEAKVRKN